MRIHAKLAAAVLLVLTAAGCPLDPEAREERLGIIQVLPDHPAQVGVPDSAVAGEPFVVWVFTRGSGCLRAGPTRVETDGMTADVRPYDLDLGDRDCGAGMESHAHVAILRMPEPGVATVRFTGIGYPGREIVTVTRTLTVR